MLSFVIFQILLVTCASFSLTSIARISNRAGTSSLSMGTLVENFRFVKHFNRFTFKTLYKCIAAAGLEDTLSGAGPFTVFAPTDSAFSELPEGTIDSLLADIPKLKAILTYHVVAGKVNGDDVKAAKTLPSLNGKAITIALDGDRAYSDDAKVLTTDVDVDNGTFHIIDQVMLP